ncbi:histone lysine methyltransferase Set9 [Tilletia horrida]|uniref:Histone lysine methyltransferase Set9 n=1 Tax=Tilletia horrida TaxID=155126 RepID=A0AAN6GMR9_9BASI|nr:histone lysine methyltransferase Set9 [Tilletia horrida]
MGIVKKYIADKDARQLNAFRMHAKKYFEAYHPDSGVEFVTSTRYQRASSLLKQAAAAGCAVGLRQGVAAPVPTVATGPSAQSTVAPAGSSLPPSTSVNVTNTPAGTAADASLSSLGHHTTAAGASSSVPLAPHESLAAGSGKVVTSDLAPVSVKDEAAAPAMERKIGQGSAIDGHYALSTSVAEQQNSDVKPSAANGPTIDHTLNLSSSSSHGPSQEITDAIMTDASHPSASSSSPSGVAPASQDAVLVNGNNPGVSNGSRTPLLPPVRSESQNGGIDAMALDTTPTAATVQSAVSKGKRRALADSGATPTGGGKSKSTGNNNITAQLSSFYTDPFSTHEKADMAVIAIKPYKEGELIEGLRGGLKDLTKEEDEAMKVEAAQARERLRPGQIAATAAPARDFSVIRSAQKGCSQLLLGPARFVNHDCNPNAEFYRTGTSISFRVLRPIAPKEEITCFYGANYFEWENAECLCETCELEGKGAFKALVGTPFSTLYGAQHQNRQEAQYAQESQQQNAAMFSSPDPGGSGAALDSGQLGENSSPNLDAAAASAGGAVGTAPSPQASLGSGNGSDSSSHGAVPGGAAESKPSGTGSANGPRRSSARVATALSAAVAAASRSRRNMTPGGMPLPSLSASSSSSSSRRPSPSMGDLNAGADARSSAEVEGGIGLGVTPDAFGYHSAGSGALVKSGSSASQGSTGNGNKVLSLVCQICHDRYDVHTAWYAPQHYCSRCQRHEKIYRALWPVRMGQIAYDARQDFLEKKQAKKEQKAARKIRSGSQGAGTEERASKRQKVSGSSSKKSSSSSAAKKSNGKGKEKASGTSKVSPAPSNSIASASASTTESFDSDSDSDLTELESGDDEEAYLCVGPSSAVIQPSSSSSAGAAGAFTGAKTDAEQTANGTVPAASSADNTVTQRGGSDFHNIADGVDITSAGGKLGGNTSATGAAEAAVLSSSREEGSTAQQQRSGGRGSVKQESLSDMTNTAGSGQGPGEAGAASVPAAPASSFTNYASRYGPTGKAPREMLDFQARRREKPEPPLTKADDEDTRRRSSRRRRKTSTTTTTLTGRKSAGSSSKKAGSSSRKRDSERGISRAGARSSASGNASTNRRSRHDSLTSIDSSLEGSSSRDSSPAGPPVLGKDANLQNLADFWGATDGERRVRRPVLTGGVTSLLDRQRVESSGSSKKVLRAAAGAVAAVTPGAARRRRSESVLTKMERQQDDVKPSSRTSGSKSASSRRSLDPAALSNTKVLSGKQKKSAGVDGGLQPLRSSNRQALKRDKMNAAGEEEDGDEDQEMEDEDEEDEDDENDSDEEFDEDSDISSVSSGLETGLSEEAVAEATASVPSLKSSGAKNLRGRATAVILSSDEDSSDEEMADADDSADRPPSSRSRKKRFVFSRSSSPVPNIPGLATKGPERTSNANLALAWSAGIGEGSKRTRKPVQRDTSLVLGGRTSGASATAAAAARKGSPSAISGRGRFSETPKPSASSSSRSTRLRGASIASEDDTLADRKRRGRDSPAASNSRSGGGTGRQSMPGASTSDGRLMRPSPHVSGGGMRSASTTAVATGRGTPTSGLSAGKLPPLAGARYDPTLRRYSSSSNSQGPESPVPTMKPLPSPANPPVPGFRRPASPAASTLSLAPGTPGVPGGSSLGGSGGGGGGIGLVNAGARPGGPPRKNLRWGSGKVSNSRPSPHLVGGPLPSLATGATAKGSTSPLGAAMTPASFAAPGRMSTVPFPAREVKASSPVAPAPVPTMKAVGSPVGSPLAGGADGGKPLGPAPPRPPTMSASTSSAPFGAEPTMTSVEQHPIEKAPTNQTDAQTEPVNIGAQVRSS